MMNLKEWYVTSVSSGVLLFFGRILIEKDSQVTSH